MSRLDAMILRLRAQRTSIEFAVREIADAPGVIIEFGLGKGRSYDHLREHFPRRDIFVFDRLIDAYPDCVPPPGRLLLGEFQDTAALALTRFRGAAILVHADIGNGDRQSSHDLAARLCPLWTVMMRAEAVLLSDQPIAGENLSALELPSPARGVYFAYRRTSRAEAGAPSRIIAAAPLTAANR
jgi:hypothetical protein